MALHLAGSFPAERHGAILTGNISDPAGGAAEPFLGDPYATSWPKDASTFPNPFRDKECGGHGMQFPGWVCDPSVLLAPNEGKTIL